jgi:hypothetical protein
MKKIAILFLFATALFNQQANAQEKTKSKPAAKSKIPVVKKEVLVKKEEKACCKKSDYKRRMAENLALTDDQKANFKKIKKEAKDRIEELSKNQSITLKEFNDKKTMILNDAREKRKSLLTSEQLGKIAAAKDGNKRKKIKEFEERLNKLISDLKLNDQQVAQLRGMHTKQIEQIEAIKNNNQLNDFEKKLQIKEIRKQNQEIKLKILTEDQRVKFFKMRKENLKVNQPASSQIFQVNDGSYKMN